MKTTCLFFLIKNTNVYPSQSIRMAIPYIILDSRSDICNVSTYVPRATAAKHICVYECTRVLNTYCCLLCVLSCSLA